MCSSNYFNFDLLNRKKTSKNNNIPFSLISENEKEDEMEDPDTKNIYWLIEEVKIQLGIRNGIDGFNNKKISLECLNEIKKILDSSMFQRKDLVFEKIKEMSFKYPYLQNILANLPVFPLYQEC